jgi:hypothetical protein
MQIDSKSTACQIGPLAMLPELMNDEDQSH